MTHVETLPITGYDPTELRSAEELLQCTELERRELAGQAFTAYWKEQGHPEVVYISNVDAALPKAGQSQLTAHGAPPTAYGGRMLGMALGMVARELPIYVVAEPPTTAENKFVAYVASELGCEPPTIIGSLDQVPDTSFIFPFMGSPETAARFPGRTIADATPFNNKANIRILLDQLEENESMVPGTEVFYEDSKSEAEFFDKIETALRAEAAHSGRGVWLKHVSTASGMATYRYGADFFDDTNTDATTELRKNLQDMFTDPETGEKHLDSVVIEHSIDFGASETGYGDFSLRGMITPNGQFVPFSLGRVISNEDGECIGAVMAQSDKPDQLDAIGLAPETLAKAARLMEKVGRDLHAKGYMGPMAVDFFGEQRNPDGQVLMRDFNVREGGTSFGGLATALSDRLWEGPTARVMDVELKADTDRQLTEAEAEALAAKLYQSGVAPYATTFLRYPAHKKAEDGTTGYVYTLKVLAPLTAPAATEPQVHRAIDELAAWLNALNMEGVAFRSPLQS